jgi:diphthamide synthase (EF-2-diphthine--ammonia ligase)
MECFINLRFKSIVTTCDPRVIGEKFCGRIINKRFLTELPGTVDPAGENGEYHSFAFDGPIFKQSVRFNVGEKVLRDGFWFCDLVPP